MGKQKTRSRILSTVLAWVIIATNILPGIGTLQKVQAAPVEETNLLVNGDFEKDEAFTQVTDSSGTRNSGWYYYQNVEKVDGSNLEGQGLSSNVVAFRGNNSSLEQDVAGLIEGATYVYTVKVKIADENDLAKHYIGVKNFGEGNTEIKQRITSTEWKEYRIEFVYESGIPRVYGWTEAHEGTDLYLDDACLVVKADSVTQTENTEVPENSEGTEGEEIPEGVGESTGLLADAGFEEEAEFIQVNNENKDNRTAGWYSYKSVEKVDGTTLDGQNLTSTVAALKENGASLEQDIARLEQGKTYVYTIKAKLANENSQAKHYIGVKNYGGEEIKHQITSAAWTEYQIEFEYQSGTPRVYGWTEIHGGTDLYLDDADLMLKAESSGTEETEEGTTRPEGEACTFYVDATLGKDTNDGLSPQTAFQTIERLNKITFEPGDKILFKKGEVFTGCFKPKGSGTKDNPIIIESYGEGIARPKLQPGDDWTVSHIMSANAIEYNKKVNYVIQFYNVSFYEISDLELHDPKSTEGRDGTYRSGITVQAEDFGVMEHIYIDNMVIHGFHGPLHNLGKSSGGITMNVITNKERNRELSVPTQINDIRVTNCEIYDVGRSGINFLTPWSFRTEEKWGPFSYGTRGYDYLPYEDFYMANNYIHDIDGDGTIIDNCANAVCENNLVTRCCLQAGEGNSASAAVGLFNWNSDDTYFQFNEVYDIRQGHVSNYPANDSQGIEIDALNDRTWVQYNYVHDNYGGFMMLCNIGDNYRSFDGIIRYNISLNDYTHPRQGLFDIYGFNWGTEIYNNTFYFTDRVLNNQGQIFMFNDANSQDTLKFYNNIFYYAEETPAAANKFGGNNIEWKNNIFYGFTNLPTSRGSSGNTHADPKFVNAGAVPTTSWEDWKQGNRADLSGYALQADSPAINGGVVVADNGGRDYFGNEVSGIPDIGAIESGDKSSKAISSLRFGISNTEKTITVVKHEKITVDVLAEHLIIEGANQIQAKRGTQVLTGPAVLKEGDTIVISPGNDPVEYTICVEERADGNYLPGSVLKATAGSEEKNQANDVAANAIDDRTGTMWHTAWNGSEAKDRHLTIEVTGDYEVRGYVYYPRTSQTNGIITKYQILAGDDLNTLEVVKEGEWARNNEPKTVEFTQPLSKKYYRLLAVESVGNFASASEVKLIGEEAKTDFEAPKAPKLSMVKNQNTVNLSWRGATDNVGVTGYLLRKNGEDFIEFTEEASEFTVTDTVEGDVFTVEAIDEAGNISGQENTITPSAPAESDAVYEIYPTPQWVKYEEDGFAIEEVNLVYDSSIDEVTKARMEKVLKSKNLKVNISHTVAEGKTNILIGTFKSAEKGNVQTYTEENYEINAADFEKFASHYVISKEGTIVVLGKDTDAAFYGVTTLKHIFAQMEDKVIRNFTIKDYADVNIRGFIEGYYGIPWSNEDRMSLMKFGGEFKMTSYIFAPKDDPYHTSKWRELYPETEINAIKEMVKVGNDNKCRFVWTAHPFMGGFRSNQVEGEIQALLAKFDQLYDAGVRQFGVLGDDVGSLNKEIVIRVMNAVSDWAKKKGDVYDTVFCPAGYNHAMQGNYTELNQYDDGFPEDVQIFWTGDAVCQPISVGTLDKFRNYSNTGSEPRRAPLFWLNWPVNDINNARMLLGKGSLLHGDVEPANLAGVVTNPMQEAESSKNALFAVADYSWNIAGFQVEQSWTDGFKYIDAEVAEELFTLAKHMSDPSPNGHGLVLEESEEIKELLEGYPANRENAQQLKAEFKKIAKACDDFQQKSKNEKLKEELLPFTNALRDRANAGYYFVEAQEAVDQNNEDRAWSAYSKASALLSASKGYTKILINSTTKAEPAAKRITPFLEKMNTALSPVVISMVDENRQVITLHTNRKDIPDNAVGMLTDNQEATELIFKTPNAIGEGEYVGLSYTKPFRLKAVVFKMGRGGNANDTMEKGKLQYTEDGKEWKDIPGTAFASRINEVKAENLDLRVKGIRIIATEAKENIWLGIKDIIINGGETDKGQKSPSGSLFVPETFLVYTGHSGREAQVFDQNEDTFIWYKIQGDNCKKDDYIGLDLGEVYPIGEVRFVMPSGDALDNYTMQYSVDGKEYKDIESFTGLNAQVNLEGQNIEARYIRILNNADTGKWLKVSEFIVSVVNKAGIYTNIEAQRLVGVSAENTSERFALSANEKITLKPGEYIGLDLERVRDIQAVTAVYQGAAALETSKNEVTWIKYESLEEGIDFGDVRYVRFMNSSNEDVELNLTILEVLTREVYPISVVDTNFGDKGSHLKAFDKDRTTEAVLQASQQAGKFIIYDLGQIINLESLKMVLHDGTTDYPRHAKVSVSKDGQDWQEVMAIGNQNGPNEKEESNEDHIKDLFPDHEISYYTKTESGINKEVRYIKFEITRNKAGADKWVRIREIELNGGQLYLPEENDPTIVTEGKQSKGNTTKNLRDGDLTTSYLPIENRDGSFTYYISEENQISRITILQNPDTLSQAKVTAQVVEEEEVKWVELGELKGSLNKFDTKAYTHVLAINIAWTKDKLPEIYEIILTPKENPVALKSIYIAGEEEMYPGKDTGNDSGDNTGNDSGNHTNDNTQNGIGQGGNGNSSQSQTEGNVPNNTVVKEVVNRVIKYVTGEVKTVPQGTTVINNITNTTAAAATQTQGKPATTVTFIQKADAKVEEEDFDSEEEVVVYTVPREQAEEMVELPEEEVPLAEISLEEKSQTNPIFLLLGGAFVGLAAVGAVLFLSKKKEQN